MAGGNQRDVVCRPVRKDRHQHMFLARGFYFTIYFGDGFIANGNAAGRLCAAMDKDIGAGFATTFFFGPGLVECIGVIELEGEMKFAVGVEVFHPV